ncbi:MAG TPA: methyltransferase domain-containing protein [Pyrinomonadaceae bacterium]|nr:methyltransferase domain-containing protein [Pyrinomonadaceae bacterium]
MAHDKTADTTVKPARRDYLREHLREVPAFRALVRSVECRLFERRGALENPALDVGCGDGHFASMAFARALFAGIDPSAALVGEARMRGVHTHLVCASATAQPFPDSFFRTVVANCVVEHIPDLDATLSEVARVLRPGGRFLFGVPSHLFGSMLLGSTLLRSLKLSRAARAYGDWFNGHSLHYHTYDPATWFARLDSHGFDVESWEYYISAEGHRAFDLAHYLSVPRLLSRKLTGRWVAFSNPLGNRLFERWLRPFYEAPAPAEGAYIFFETRKRGTTTTN